MGRRSVPLWLPLMLMALAPAAADAQLTESPAPIVAPPIPSPPRIGPAPKIDLPAPRAGVRPVIDLPGAPSPAPVEIPPQGQITQADKADPIPPPKSAALTGPSPRTSPGASASQIQELAFIVDPGSSQLPDSARAKLIEVARAVSQDAVTRVEIRAYSPAKQQSGSAARRLSLARFLSIRDFLVANGVDDNRIDGRALASRPTELNADRVELYIEN